MAVVCLFVCSMGGGILLVVLFQFYGRKKKQGGRGKYGRGGGAGIDFDDFDDADSAGMGFNMNQYSGRGSRRR